MLFRSAGRAAEDYISKLYTIHTGNTFLKSNILHVHKKYKFVIGNLDGYVKVPELGVGIAELKNTTSAVYNSWKKEGLPKTFYYQVQHYLLLTGMSFAQCIVLIDGWNLKIIEVFPNKEIFNIILDAENDFWYEHIVKEIPPEPLSNNEFLKGFVINDISLETVEENYEIVQKIALLKADIKSREAEKNILELQIKRLMINAGVLKFHGETICTFKEYERGSIDIDRLKNENPEIYNQYRETNKYRTLKERK